MSYIIVAEVDTEDEVNLGGEKENVNASILSEREGIIKFDVKGDHMNKAERTKVLCHALIDSGYFAFEIRHSY